MPAPLPHEMLPIEAYEKAEEAILTMAETAADEIATRSIAGWHIKAIVDAAAPVIQRSQRFRTRMALERITQAAEAYLTRSAEADEARRAELRRHLADATTDAWMLLRPNSAGVGADQDAPPARQDGPGAANTPESVAQYPPESLRGAQAVPDTVPPIVRMAAQDAANAGANAGLGTTIEEAIDAAITATWAGAHQHLAEHYRAQGRQQAAGALAYETTCLRCAQQLDQLAAERAAGIAEGITGARDAAAELVADAAFDWTGETQRTIQAIAGRVRDMRLEAHDADEPMRIAGYQPDTLDELMAQVDDDVRKLVTDSEIPPNLIPPDGATSAAEFARIQDNDPVLTALRARAGAGNPGIEQMFTGPIALARGDRLRAQLDRSLALLHDVLDRHWLDLPGRPAGQPGAMRFLDGDQLAGWRQRMAAIEEAAG